MAPWAMAAADPQKDKGAPTTSLDADVNAVIHALNALFCLGFYLIFRHLKKRTTEDPPDDDDDDEAFNKSAKLPDPEYERGASLHFMALLLGLAGIPSLLQCLFYAVMKPLCEGDPGQTNLPTQYNKNAYMRQQLILTGFALMHAGIRFWAHTDAKARSELAFMVVEQMRLKGSERCLVVRCGRGMWVNNIAKWLERGGKVTGVDDWNSKAVDHDAAWALENARRESMESRVLIEVEPKEIDHLDIKDECVDVCLTPFDEELNEPKYYQELCEMNRVLRPGGKLIAVQPFAEPSIIEDIMQEFGYTKIRQKLMRHGYNMNKVVVGNKPEDAGALHAKDGQGASAGINIIDADYTNESPGLSGVSAELMIFFLMVVGLYGVGMLNVFMFFEWQTFDYPKEFRTYNRINGGLLTQLSIWVGYAFIAVYIEMKQRSKFTIRRVGVVKMWSLYCLQFVGGAVIWVGLAYATRLWLRKYGLTAQWGCSLMMVLPTAAWVFITSKIRIFTTMQTWRRSFGTRPEGSPSRLKQFVESDEFDFFMISTIILAGALVGCSTVPSLQKDSMLRVLEHLVLFIFTIECAMKIAGEWPKPWMYFMGPNMYWNCFDFAIVAIGIVNFIVKHATGSSGGADFIMVIRLFRLMRIFKMFKQIQQLRIVVSTLFVVLSNVMYVFIIICLMLYIFGCGGAIIFQKNDPRNFGSLVKSMISCVSVMTRNWYYYFETEYYGCKYGYTPPLSPPSYMADCKKNKEQGFMAILFFLTFIMFMVYVLYNMILAMIIVYIDSAIAQVKKEDWEAAEAEEPGSGGAPAQEVKDLMSRIECRNVLAKMKEEAAEYRNDIKRFRRMILYIRPRQR